MQLRMLGKERRIKFSVLTRWNNKLTFNAKVEAAQADPALEYEDAPEYQDPPLYD